MPGVADRSEVRAVEVLLSEMHEVACLFDGQLPIVVYDELRAVRSRKPHVAARILARTTSSG